MKKIAALIACIAIMMPALAQENQVTRIPTVPSKDSNSPRSVRTYETGFWIAPELTGGITCRTNHPNLGFGEFDVSGGYRFCQYLKVGIGAAVRYYFNNDKVRFKNTKVVFPLYFNVRGNMIDETYRTTVPYYSFDIGATTQDGFMVRPTVGIRIGESRGAFLLGLSYVGQNYRVKVSDGTNVVRGNHFISGVALRVGYEF